jgi:hypothetical protein
MRVVHLNYLVLMCFAFDCSVKEHA